MSNEDAFGNERVASPTNRFDVEFIYNKQPDIVDEVIAGNATATHQANSRDVVLDVVETTENTSAALYGYDVPYTPGNSQKIDITGTVDNAGLGTGTAFLFFRTKISGSVVTDLYPQDEWAAGLDDMVWSRSHILQMDFQSLKVGLLRMGFVRRGKYVEALDVANDNLRATGYWQSPSLPAYWRVYNTASYTYAEMGYGDTENGLGLMYRMPLTADATVRAICATVKSEGGTPLFDLPGYQRSTLVQTAKTVSTTLVPILSIRPAATYNSIANRGLYIPDGFEITANNPLAYVLLWRPTLTDADWTAVDATNSGMEYDVTASAVTGGVRLLTGYFASGRNSMSKDAGLLGRTLLRLRRTGVSDILTLAGIRTDSSDASTRSAFNWRELR